MTMTTFLKDHQIINPCPQKSFSLQKKNQASVMPVLPSQAGIMPENEKNLLITGFLVKVCFIQN